MRFVVLVGGASDVPVVRSVFTRRFGLVEGLNFSIHPHKGRGNLPRDLLGKPDLKQQTLLHQLPTKLKGYSYLGDDACVLVLVDVDSDPCDELLAQLNAMLAQLPKRPPRVIFRLAIEETESWLIADVDAITVAYPKARTQKLRRIAADGIVGAWKELATALNIKTSAVTGADKYAWAERISPHLNLDEPHSPSLRKFIEGIRQEVSRAMGQSGNISGSA